MAEEKTGLTYIFLNKNDIQNEYQTKIDEALKTNSKKITGAINELKAGGSNVCVDNGINEDDLNTMLTNTFGFVAE